MTCENVVSDPLIEVDRLIEVHSIGQGGHNASEIGEFSF